MMSLILQLTAQIKEIEVQMDQLVQEKETVKEPLIPTVILVITTAVPSTLGEKLAPKEPLATTVPVTSSTTSATESSTTTLQPTDESSQLVKEMEEMSLKTNEINRLIKIIENLEKTNKSTQIDAKIHEQNAHRLSEEVKKLQKELNLKDRISYIKNYLWNNVIEAIHDV